MNTNNTNTNMNMDASSMSSAIQQAIFFNNKGTRLVRQCQYGGAVQSFTSVLKILKPLAVIVEGKHAHRVHHSYEGNNNHDNATDDATDDETDDNTDANTDVDADASTVRSMPLTISFNNKSIDTGTNEDDTLTRATQMDHPSSLSLLSLDTASDSASDSITTKSSFTTSTSTQKLKSKHFVFRDPVFIPPESTTYMTDDNNPLLYYSHGLLSKFLMIVMYNLALTLHLHALSLVSLSSSSSSSSSSTSTSSSTSSSSKYKRNHMKDNKNKIQKLYIRSKQLYELALKMHLEHVVDDIDPLFLLALTNNLGLVYHTMKDKVRSKLCYQNMFSTMMYLLDSHHEDSSTQSQSSDIKECIWDGLLSNAMKILFKHTYEIAAAAA